MDWLGLIALMIFAGALTWFVSHGSERRHVLTQQGLRCPLHDCRATVTVRTVPEARAGRRYRDVAACSLLPTTWGAPQARAVYFPDLAPCERYLCNVGEPPRLAEGVACPKHCLFALNAAEAGPRWLAPADGDALELARQTQPPAIMRLLWHYGA